METQELDVKPKSESPKSVNGKWILIGMVAILIGINVCMLSIINSQSNKLDSQNNIILKEETDKSNCVYKRDSLTVELNRLAIYKSLTSAMVYRDEVIMQLKYQIGDIAHTKRDSSQIVISDIVIGGSKYEYYIKYKIIHKDNTMEEIIPELIY